MAKKAQHGGKRPGAGRPRKYEARTLTISMAWPVDLLADVDEDRGEMSRSEYTVKAARRYLQERRRRSRRNGS